jgi:hypothetical protein
MKRNLRPQLLWCLGPWTKTLFFPLRKIQIKGPEDNQRSEIDLISKRKPADMMRLFWEVSG